MLISTPTPFLYPQAWSDIFVSHNLMSLTISNSTSSKSNNYSSSSSSFHFLLFCNDLGYSLNIPNDGIFWWMRIWVQLHEKFERYSRIFHGPTSSHHCNIKDPIFLRNYMLSHCFLNSLTAVFSFRHILYLASKIIYLPGLPETHSHVY